MRNLIDIQQLSVEEIDELIALANDIIAHPDDYREKCRYKKLATLFFEPSTRTRLSFEAANKRPLSPGTSREASGVPCLNPRRGLTLLSPVCRDPAIGV